MDQINEYYATLIDCESPLNILITAFPPLIVPSLPNAVPRPLVLPHSRSERDNIEASPPHPKESYVTLKSGGTIVS